MSAELVSLALRQRIEDRTEKLILIVFAEHADADGLAWPSVDLVAAEAQCSGRTVQRAIGRFIDIGYLQLYHMAKGRGRPICYRVNPEATGRAPSYRELREAQRAASHRALAAKSSGRDSNIQGELLPELSTKGDTQVSPFSDGRESLKGDKNALKGDKNALKGDTAMSPEHRTYNQGQHPVDNFPPAPSSPNRNHPKKSRKRSGEVAALPTITEIKKRAVFHGLPDGQRRVTESAAQFCSRIDQAISLKISLERDCARLKIPWLKPGETMEQFERRVTKAVLKDEGRDSDLPPDEARRQALRV